MEWLSNLTQHTAERYRALVAPTRTVCLVVAVVVLGGLVLLAVGRMSGPYQPLFEGRSFSLRELAKMTAAFQAAGLCEARMADGRLLVPRAKLDAYLVALDAADALPADFDDSLDEIAADSNPFASRQQTELGYRVAEQKKLARILSGMNGIETASVQYAEVRKSGFPPTWDVRAVVAVRADGNRELAYEEIEAIRDTVTGFVAGLERSQVTVSDLNACRAYPGGDGPGSAAAKYAARTEQARLEESFRTKIQDRLTAYPGSIVGVQVQLADAHETTAADPAKTTGPRFIPALVSASVDLPRSCFVQLWRERYAAGEHAPDRPALQTLEDEVKHSVEQAVLALLPPPAAELRGHPQVVVTSYADPAAPVETSIAGLGSSVAAWAAAHWSLLVGGCLLIGSVVLVVCNRRPAAARGAISGEAASADVVDRPATVSFAASLPLSPGGKKEVHVQVQRAIQENPQAAAEALQRWLRKAA
jgi:flagellar biosynthesis/type III secretory pathway M-ring protein FliF/YscJ